MSGQGLRAEQGGLVDRSRPLRFRFDGREYEGYAGDTLASALLANGVRLAGRSFKLHRPRGLFAAGVEEANVLVEAGRGSRRTTNLRATEILLEEGLEARPVNAWPSLRFDLGSANGALARFLKAGFYYKTFMWPTWHLYEGAIRRAAGLGRPAIEPDPDRYEQAHAHCDTLVIGGGPAGLAAARAAAAAGARVVLAEQDEWLGGSLLWREAVIGGDKGRDWAARGEAELRGRPDVRVLVRTTAIAYYDDDLVALLERPNDGPARERLWKVRARRVIIATGAFERPLLFAGNDKPGVMLASGAHEYVGRYGALAGRNIVVATNNDSAYPAAAAMFEAGARVHAIVDSRREAAAARELVGSGIRRIGGGRILRARGFQSLQAVEVLTPCDRIERLSCDALLVSGGWNPDVHLFSQAGGKLAYDEALTSFRPVGPLETAACIGAANGCLAVDAALREGDAAGRWAANNGELEIVSWTPPERLEPEWLPALGEESSFVDLQNDVTIADIRLAAQENFRSVEHLKRYTTLGMAVDQGKTANVNALAVMGALTGRAPGEVGTTRFRPPYVPTSIGAFAGLKRGELYRPFRQTPLHDRHAALGAVFEEFGGWQRPAHYVRPGEDRAAAMRREALAVRGGVGLFDASPLGKIEVVGPDAATFLDRVYANRMSNLVVGRVRYGLMLSELGVVIDDGVVARMAQDHFLVGTTSGAADRIAATLEEWLQCEWRELRAIVAPVTALWGNVTVAGPAAGEVLAAAGCDIDLAPAAFPHLSWREGVAAELPARIARVGFTGELSYEVSVPAAGTPALWDALVAAAASFGGMAIGVDAWMLLRLEKGFPHVGTDTDGTTLPVDIGWTKVSQRHGDFIGKRSLLWDANRGDDRLQLVGLAAEDGRTVPPIGTHIRGDGASARSQGFVTSAEFSPTLKRPIALGLVRGGRSRKGDTIELMNGQSCRIVDPVFYDTEGARMHG